MALAVVVAQVLAALRHLQNKPKELRRQVRVILHTIAEIPTITILRTAQTLRLPRRAAPTYLMAAVATEMAQETVLLADLAQETAMETASEMVEALAKEEFAKTM